MWIEDYRIANGLEADELAHRVNLVGKKIMRPPLGVTVSDTLIYTLEVSPRPRTHPRIADAIAIACNATKEQRDSIVAKCHRGTWEPGIAIGTVGNSSADANKIGDGRSVVKVDSNGNVISRYKSIVMAAKATGMSVNSILRRCAGSVKGEFTPERDYTFRYASTWDTMNRAQRLKDLGVDVVGD